MKHVSFSLFFFICLLFPLHSLKAETKDFPLWNELEEWTASLLKNNPQIQALESEIPAAQTRLQRVLSFEPLTAGVEFMKSPSSSFPDPYSDRMETEYTVQQMIPFAGKRKRMAAAEEWNVKMKEKEVQSLKNSLRKKIKQTLFEYCLLSRKKNLVLENKKLMERIALIAEKEYSVNTKTSSDYLRIRNEITGLEEKLLMLDEEQKTLFSMLQSYTDLPLPSIPGFTEAEPVLYSFESPFWEQFNSEDQPDLLAMRYLVEMKDSEKKATLLEFYPDLMIKGTYTDPEEKNLDGSWSLMLEVNLPFLLWGRTKVNTEISLREQEIRKSEAQLRNMVRMNKASIETACHRINTSIRQISLSRSAMLPQTESLLNSQLTAYQNGQTEFLMLMDAYRMLLQAREDYHENVMKLFSAYAELEEATGLSLNVLISTLKQEKEK